MRLIRVADKQCAYAQVDTFSQEITTVTDATRDSDGIGDLKEVPQVVGTSGIKILFFISCWRDVFIGPKLRWTDEELDRLYVSAEKYGTVLSVENMIKVAKDVGTKSAAQCRNKLISLSQSEKATHEWIEDRLKSFNQELYQKPAQ